MNRHDLELLVESLSLGQSDLARLAGVSRQAVSLWFKGPDGGMGMRASHLIALSRNLGMSLDELTSPVGLDEKSEQDMKAELLWDGLYPGLAGFCAALARGEDRALARLVQVYGLYKADAVAGESVWTGFPRYKRHVHPGRREGLEAVWRFETSRA
ncbi:MAG: helix-turn-helix domain-containing protein [Elusimicrobia bacterium]|nr:helix-turn-helix domain-containing protein [Elusimicrobiota bacterium]